jgi:hypothetical protein
MSVIAPAKLGTHLLPKGWQQRNAELQFGKTRDILKRANLEIGALIQNRKPG